ncbi:hypothetical protein LMG23992_02635 [Cupriavidus laharis]|uniref:Uncharacterized protein n=1 Tax=Cupriavidus laharis TaxID=151654 RepID=A0ABM8X2K1_9BURK|nr:hypothetical protein [Cupriavidus laharis]CAG9174120.1 hypothetical protein LMG23992_02635 [Cupriavidus laharis]
MRLLYLIYGLIVLFGATFYNLGSGDYKSGSSGGSGRIWGGSSGGNWSSGGGHK